jgi:hypothetical protein
VEAVEWRERRGHDARCDNTARYAVDGRKLCRRHAAAAVLDALAG